MSHDDDTSDGRSGSGERSSADIRRHADRAIAAGDVAALEQLLREHREAIRTQHPSQSDDPLAPDFESGEARRIIFTAHRFDSWPAFAAHAEARGDRTSAVARFEAAVEAIIDGDEPTLARLLQDDPALVRARSARLHRSTLLHYTGANGVEGFRQRTPANIVRITEMLIDAGADVDAFADMYGGSTTLGLVATSVHPYLAGMQQPLLEFLLARGARMDRPGLAGHAHPLVNACLANGRPEAAAFLASRGAPLDVEAAAGVGRLDLVRSFVDGDGRARSHANAGGDSAPRRPDGGEHHATPTELRAALSRAAAGGHTDIVRFLLDGGLDVAAPCPPDGQTPLHAAAYGAHVDTVELLLARHATVDVTDATYRTTPLIWALHAWVHERGATPPDRFYRVVTLLVAAGATVRPEWIDDDDLRGDPRMIAALTRR